MKTLFKSLPSLTFLLLLLLVASCSKKESAEPQGDGIVGRWDLVQTSGGLTGATVAVSAGTRQLEFTADGTVRLYERGTLINTQQYSIEKSISDLSGQEVEMLFYISPGVRSTRQIVVVDSTTLMITDDYADGQTYHYQRVRQ